MARATVAAHYRKWREAQGLPRRCDNPKCRFHTERLIWNRRQLPLVLDHKEGNANDNRPEMLRYLCPNCDSQLETRGGKNRGRVKNALQSFTITERDGRRAYTYFPSGRLRFGGSADVRFVPVPRLQE